MRHMRVCIWFNAKNIDPTRGPLGVPAGVAARHCFCDLNRSDRAGKS